jgi:amino acid adenylation domain-containing protein
MKLPAEQEAIRAKCFHPSGMFVEFPKEDVEASIPARFEKIVSMYPERIAIKTTNQTLNYDQTNRMANRVARAILDKRGERNEPIAIFLKHDIAAIIAILGVLKTGKIYVPLDSSFSATSIQSILTESQASLLIVNDHDLGRCNSISNIETLMFGDWEDRVDDESPDLTIAPDAIANILYTSGSTGKPKGVFKNHRGILHNIRSYTNDIHISREDRLTLLHSCATNASVRNLLGALLNGSGVYLMDPRVERLRGIVEWLIRERITIYHSSASLFRALTDAITLGEHFDDLRLIQLSNEVVTTEDERTFRKFFASNCIFANRLGSTETDTFSRWFVSNDKSSLDNLSVPAGFPVEGTEVLLLDDSLKSVGFDSVGEIVVKSDNLALGYWQQPELTRAKFRPDPYGEDVRWYFTGDLGQMTADGCLYVLGRKDFTVKLRGRTIILSEIETALLEYPAVKEVAVISSAEPNGDQRLVAYVAASRAPAPTFKELRNFLTQKLPDHMVPSVFVMLDALPLTPNGKVDRGALPPPEQQRPQREFDHVEPRTPTEEKLASIWADVLKAESLSIHDNFFELGGHSLAAARIVTRVVQTFQLELPVKALFESPSVAEMAAVIMQNQSKRVSDEELAQMLREIEVMTEEDAQRYVSDIHSTIAKK